MNLTKQRWPLGWIPSDDDVNGRSDGLLRMDNCYLDERGVLSLVQGTERVNSSELSGTVHSLYSKFLVNSKHRFAGLGDGTVKLDTGSGAFAVTLLEGGHPEYAVFSNALGQILIASGNKKRRFNGTQNLDLGLQTPGAPQILASNGPVFVIKSGDGSFEDVELVEGDNLVNVTDGVQFDTTSTRAVLKLPAAVNSILSADGSVGGDEDTFHFNILIGDTSFLSKVRVEVVLDDLDVPGEYYFYEWINDENGPFNLGINTWTTLEILRRQFERAGTDSTKDWSTVIGLRLTIETTDVIANNIVNEFVFYGGSKGPLSGRYKYIQVNVHNTGVYQAKSGASPISEEVNVINGKVTVTPFTPIDEFVNEIWIYRRSSEDNIDLTRIGEPRKLDQFYRVKVLNSDSGLEAFDDIQPDYDALLEGTTVYHELDSIANITDYILGITDLVYDRVLYLTEKYVVISSSFDPDSYNPLHSIKLSGNTFERNLWIAKVGEGRVLIGTTEDIYEISGTFRELPDFTLDVSVRGLGLGFAPISRNYCTDGGTVYYIAADGWRATAGSDTKLLLGDIELLFKGQARYGIEPVAIYPQGLAIYACAIYKNELWTYNNFTDGTRAGLIYDFTLNYWRYHKLETVSLYVEEDGVLIGGFGGGSGNYVQILDSGSDLAGINGQDVRVLTIFDANGQPRNRKDTFTLKITAVTGTKPVTIQIAKDKGAFTTLGTFTASTMETQFFTLSGVTLGFRYAIQIVGGDLSVFKLYEFDIEYEPRPEQLNYLRIQPTNLGTFARKRFTSYAFVVDTLGNTVTFTPYVDNTAGTATTFSRDYKGTYVHYFTSETLGTDISGILSGGVFEFYQVNLEETVSEKLPTPTKYLVIPGNDYGNPNRKRHSSYKFQIDTRGQNVTFTPVLDGVSLASSTVNTTGKRTHEHFFTVDTIGIDIGGILDGGGNEFEFYGTVVPQDLEVLPPRLKEFHIPSTNWGVAARKRVRTIPMIINTNGYDVTYTPDIDNAGSYGETTTFNTPSKKTVFHYFDQDIFAIDISGELTGAEPFEFYGMIKPEVVDVLPVGKKFDQIGPMDFPRIAKLLGFRLRVVMYDSALPYEIFVDGSSRLTGSITTSVGVDNVYEELKLPKTIAGSVYRFVFGPVANAFHRYHFEGKFNVSGKDSDARWISIK